MAFVGSVEDRLAIRELIESYANAVTQRDAVAWASLWAEDSRWLMPELGTGVSLSGKETIVSTWVSLMAEYHGPAAAPWAFSFVSVLGGIEVEGDRARVLSYSIEAFADGAGATTHLKGQYSDVVVRRDGRWLFEERIWRLMPLDDYAAMSA
jgi:uncharacterized protein (TIGR02246 family)